jgi:hypothetical protein
MASATGREEIIFKIVVSVPSQLEARTIAERSLKGPIIFAIFHQISVQHRRPPEPGPLSQFGPRARPADRGNSASASIHLPSRSSLPPHNRRRLLSPALTTASTRKN